MSILNKTEIHKKLNNPESWTNTGNTLRKEFEFDNFKQALAFIVQIGVEAELHGHHPTLKNTYSHVTVELTTHDAGNQITEKDVDLANAIDGIL